MEKVTLNGRVRLTLRPLMDDMPIVAAIQVSPYLWLAYMLHCKLAPYGKHDQGGKDRSPGGVCDQDVSPASLAVLHDAC